LRMREWRSPMCGSDTCTQSALGGAWGPAPPARRAGGRPTSRTAHARPREFQFNCRHGRRARRRRGTRAPDVQSPGAGRPTLNQTPARPRSLVRSPSVRRPAGRVLERRRDAPRCVASHRDCTASARLGSSSPGSCRSGRDVTRHTAAGGTERASNPSPHLATSMLRVVHQSQLKDRSRCESFCTDRHRHHHRHRHASLLWACFHQIWDRCQTGRG
jgi:hypothetical protein